MDTAASCHKAVADQPAGADRAECACRAGRPHWSSFRARQMLVRDVMLCAGKQVVTDRPGQRRGVVISSSLWWLPVSTPENDDRAPYTQPTP